MTLTDCPPEIISAIAAKLVRRDVLNFRRVSKVVGEAIDSNGEFFRIAMDAALDYITHEPCMHALDLVVPDSPLARILRKCHPARCDTTPTHLLMPEVVLTTMFKWLLDTDLCERGNFFEYDMTKTIVHKTVDGNISTTHPAFPMMYRDNHTRITDAELEGIIDTEERMRQCGIFAPVINAADYPTHQYDMRKVSVETGLEHIEDFPRSYPEYTKELLNTHDIEVKTALGIQLYDFIHNNKFIAVAGAFVAKYLADSTISRVIDVFMICDEYTAKDLITDFIKLVNVDLDVIQTSDFIYIRDDKHVVKIAKTSYANIDCLLYGMDIPANAVARYNGKLLMTHAAYYVYTQNVSPMNHYLWTVETCHRFITSSGYTRQWLNGHIHYDMVRYLNGRAVDPRGYGRMVYIDPLNLDLDNVLHLVDETADYNFDELDANEVPTYELTADRIIEHNLTAVAGGRIHQCASHTSFKKNDSAYLRDRLLETLFIRPVCEPSDLFTNNVTDAIQQIDKNIKKKIVAVVECVALDDYINELFTIATKKLESIITTHHQNVIRAIGDIDINGMWPIINENNIAKTLELIDSAHVFQ
jgi:hypothetical protein